MVCDIRCARVLKTLEHSYKTLLAYLRPDTLEISDLLLPPDRQPSYILPAGHTASTATLTAPAASAVRGSVEAARSRHSSLPSSPPRPVPLSLSPPFAIGRPPSQRPFATFLSFRGRPPPFGSWHPIRRPCSCPSPCCPLPCGRSTYAHACCMY